MLMHVVPLPPEALYRRVDTSQWAFRTTADLPDTAAAMGQERAGEALRFGINMRHEGYNLFVLAPAGVGANRIVRSILSAQAAQEPVPSDWCYVHNFDQPYRPKMLRLPAAHGAKLRGDMEELVEDLRTAIPAAFDSEEYRARRHEIDQQHKERQEKAFEGIRADAAKEGFVMIHTPTGMAFAPVKADKIVGPEEFSQLPEEERRRIQEAVGQFRERLERIVAQVPQLRRDHMNAVRELDEGVIRAAAGGRITELKKRWAAFPNVLDYLNAVESSVATNSDDFRGSDGDEEPAASRMLLGAMSEPSSQRRYEVNVLIDHGASAGAPVVYLDNPAHPELIGRVEYLARMGALVTDFTLIKPGALHRANGGYLILDAQRLLQQPYAWEGLKRSLSAEQIRIESLGQVLSLVSTVSLDPEPIPLSIKIVLLGERWVYYLLYQADPDFRQHFKVVADFNDDTERTAETERQFAHMAATIARREGLKPIECAAVARLAEHGSRMASDGQKLSVRMQDLADLLREADYWAGQAKRDVTVASDVEQAIQARVRRQDRVRDQVQEAIQRGTLLIDTQGAKIGQVNGLSVAALGEFSFGHPVRITARVRLGRGEVLDIQREVKLSGPIHSKGVLILAGFVGARYAAGRPLSLSASLVFEQTYGEVEGDSASCAEMCALLSALSEIPIRQSLAITGSVNQHGLVQAIGGVNEKIEGFFDTCKARGLAEGQGVVIPAANTKDLMLRADVVAASQAGLFRVYSVSTVDEALELLTGEPAGERGADGRFPEGSVNRRVEDGLLRLSEQARAFSARPEGEHAPPSGPPS